ncbi:LuxR family transcriptional regulator [Glaciihabitans arcticus]|uniref:LuxR family transcriptional regulator n=1 Tax=Glaciihabitans arcticus TaxID=2668039 RepID=A0A4Q9GRZ5_9MICO|nr:LuxR family transcriptional regulator [Glaciihabitans arcticus]TBN57756.1 LuxR family transcriptional regulator [Glaciihabitans arcticus]
MVDRLRERTALAAAADRARAGHATVVTLEGEPGIGKTWLINELVAALRDFTVTNTVPKFASEPTLVVIDDAQWLEPAVVTRTAKQLDALRTSKLLVVIAGRTGESRLIERLSPGSSRPDRGSVLSLGPLGTQQVIELAGERGISALEITRAHLLAELTDGNPQHLVAAFEQLGQRLYVSVPRSLPVPADFDPALRRDLATVSKEGRAMLELLALIGTPISISALVEIAMRAGVQLSFDDASASGHLEVFNQEGQRELTLKSVRVREGIRRSLDTAKARRLHAAIAESMTGTRRLEHLLSSTEHTNDSLAAELEAEGVRHEAAGQYPEAARMFSRASGVTSGAAERERRLLYACVLAFYSDDAELASTLAPSVARCAPSLARQVVLGGIGYLLGDFPESLSLVTAALDEYPSDDDALGTGGLFTAAVVASLQLAAVDLPAAITTSATALSRLGLEEGGVPSPAEARLRITLGFSLWIAGAVDDSDVALASVLALPATRPERADALTIYAQREFYRGDTARALRTVTTAVEAARSSNALHIIPLGLALRSHVNFALGQWDDAMLDAQAVLAHTTASRNGNHDVLAHGAIAMMSAHSGELDFAERSVRIARRLGVERPLPQHTAAAAIAAAVVERVGGHPHAVVHALSPMLEGSLALGLTSTGYTGWRAMHAEALISLGSYERASSVIRLLESEPGSKSFGYTGWLHGMLAEAQGDLPEAIAAYRAALAAGDESTSPFPHALALKSLAGALEANGESGHATAAARDATRLFTRLGATVYLTGAAPTEDGVAALEGWSTLTPREHDTSLLASEGMLNREIAAAMHVSVKTVEHHIANSLAKLGLRSRRDLEKAAGRGSA